MRVISIQSQVVHGHVGNSAAVYPMQAYGIEVAAVPTALLSNHPHYATMHGSVLDAAFVSGLLTGIDERGWVETAAMLLTGYLGSPDNAEVVALFVENALQRNPALTYVCDPVIGDTDLGVFVNPALEVCFRERLVPLAKVITPNQFELGRLAGMGEPRTTADMLEALSRIRKPGQAAVVTGCVLEDTPAGRVETICFVDGRLSRTAVERLPIRPCGTGDLLTALLVAELGMGNDLPVASKKATATIFEVLRRTQAAGAEEMEITGFPFAAAARPG